MEQTFYILLLYLFYGGSFFAIGVAITSRNRRLSSLSIAKYLWIFALFAYFHAAHEWLEMFFRLKPIPLPDTFFLTASIFKLTMVSLSFFFLLFFGASIIKPETAGKRKSYVLFYILVVGILLPLAVSMKGTLSMEYFSWADFSVRKLVGLPGALLSGTGFVLFSTSVRDVSIKGARNFIGAGCTLIIYGLLTSIIPSGTIIPIVNVPIELFRGLSAFLILHFMMNALYIFDEERKAEIEERLSRFAQSEKLSAIGRLAAGVAHEVNNPLSNVSLNLEMIKRDLVKKGLLGGQEKRIQAVERNLERASKITQELLNFSSERDLEFTEIGSEETLKSVMYLLGPRKNDYDFSVKLNGSPTVLAVPWKIEEALLNILINAMDATPPGGKIAIHAGVEKGRTVMSVSDSGSGIEPGDLDRVLDPFFTTKEVGAGTGLGLSICYGIMQMHGGDLEISSTPGQGTTVKLIFSERDQTNEQDIDS